MQTTDVLIIGAGPFWELCGKLTEKKRLSSHGIGKTIFSTLLDW